MKSAAATPAGVERERENVDPLSLSLWLFARANACTIIISHRSCSRVIPDLLFVSFIDERGRDVCGGKRGDPHSLSSLVACRHIFLSLSVSFSPAPSSVP